MTDLALPVAPPAARARLTAARRRGRRRAAAVVAALTTLTAAAFTVSLSLGEFPIPLADVLGALVGAGDEDTAFVVTELRLPRALCAILVGAAFGLAGAVFQTVARNELASPDIIGITAGASVGAVFVIAIAGEDATAIPVAALAGALATATAMFVLSARGGVSGQRFVLVGIGFAAVLTSITSYLLTLADIRDVEAAVIWLTGSLGGRTWDDVGAVAVALAVLAPALLLGARGLRGLELGDDTAAGLGVRVRSTRVVFLVAAVGLTAFGVATAGPIAFVAFVAAPIARRLVGGGALALLPAALVGAALLSVADVVAREAFGTVELPVGILTALLGAPYLLWLLARAGRIGGAA